MLLQTNSYIVPKERRAEHARLMKRFRQILHRIGCDDFEVYEQVGNNWSSGSATGRFVQIMRFRDRKHQVAVQNLERTDPTAQELIAEFCELVNYPYQQQNGLFAVGFYSTVLPVAPGRGPAPAEAPAEEEAMASAPGGEFGSEQPHTEPQEGTTAYAQMPPEEESAQPEEQPAETPAPEQATTDDTSPQDPATEQPEERADEWAHMDESAVVTDDEDEPLGLVLSPGPADDNSDQHAPANGDMNHGPEEDEDDLARMADRLAEPDETPTPRGETNRPRRR
jgi:hypothetical protein